jgi:hypothetical protein
MMVSIRLYGVTSEKTNNHNVHRLCSTELKDDSADELQECVKMRLSVSRYCFKICWILCRNLVNQYPGWDSTTKQAAYRTPQSFL